MRKNARNSGETPKERGTLVLAIDIGNTNMEFGIFRGGKLEGSFRLGTNREATSDEMGLLISQYFLIHNIQRGDVQDVVISSVVPQMMYSIQNAIKKYIGRRPLVVGANLPVPIENRYGSPSEVGADRLVNALAGFTKYGGPLVVVDFGTATTFDAIDASGAYLGGAIYPGIRISMDALFQKTAKLPRVELVNPGSVIGKSTVSSMQAGAVYGYVGAVRGIVQAMQEQLGENTRIIATGGFSQLLGNEAGIFYKIDRSLTLDGLMMIYEEYKRGKRQ